MSIYRGKYYSASSCTGSARTGAKALMSWYLGAYGNRGAANLGIYVCKRLGSGWSIHGEGRAGDLGTAPYNRPGGNWPDWGWALANALVANSKELGVQLVIFNGRVWSCRYPDSGFRKYKGTDPHDGHLHVELTPESAASLTVAKIQSILGGAGASPELSGGIMLPKQGDESTTVGYWQDILDSLGYTLKIDDDYGPKTTAAVRAWHTAYLKRHGSKATPTSGKEITHAIALELQKEAFGPTDAQIAAAVAAYLRTNPPALPASVTITGGKLTGIKAA